MSLRDDCLFGYWPVCEWFRRVLFGQCQINLPKPRDGSAFAARVYSLVRTVQPRVGLPRKFTANPE